MPIRPSDFDLAPDPAAFLLHPGYSGPAAALGTHAAAAPVLGLEQRDLLTRAGQLAAQGSVPAAINLLEQTLREQPQNSPAWFALAWYLGKQDNFKKSSDCYRKGLELDASNKIAWNNLGHGLRHLRRLRQSEESLRRSIAIDPAYATAWTNLGITLKDRRKLSDAAAAFGQAVGLNPADGSSWYWLGICRARLRDDNAAIDAFRKAIALNSDDWDAWAGLGDSLKRMGYAQQAREAYSKAAGFVAAPDPLGWAELLLALIFIAFSFAVQLHQLFGLGAVIAFALLLFRLKLPRVQLFVVLVAALPLLSAQFAGDALAAEICAGLLVLWTAVIGRLWRRLHR